MSPLGKLFAVVGARLPDPVVERLRGLRLLAQFLVCLTMTDRPLLWANARLEPLGVALAPELQAWIGLPSFALFAGLVIWEVAYDARHPRSTGSRSSLPSKQSDQSLYLFWLAFSAMMGVISSIFFDLSAPVCVAIAVAIGIPAFIPGVRDRFFDFLFGKREAPSELPREAE